MSNEEMEQLLDENQHMKNQRKWAMVALAMGAGLVAWGCMRGHDEPKAETYKPVIAVPSVTRQVYSPPVAVREAPASPEPQEQPVTPEQDEAAANDAAAVPQALTQPQAATAPAPAPAPPKWQSFSGSLSLGGGARHPGYPYPYRSYAAPYAAPLRGGWYRPAPIRPAPFRPMPLRGGFRPAPAPFRSAPLGGGIRSFGGAARSFGGGRRR